MFYKIIIIYVILKLSIVGSERPRCLTGHMTDVQSWVNEHGGLTQNAEKHSTIDVSQKVDPMAFLEDEMKTNFRRNTLHTVKFLSVASCYLTAAPPLPMLQDSQGRRLTVTIEYYTLYGNNFGSYSNILKRPPSEYIEKLAVQWASGFREQFYTNLLELDLRRCSIEVIDDEIFKNMPKLKALYLGENEIHLVKSFAFDGLPNLSYLDLSQNYLSDSPLAFETDKIFDSLTNLRTLDLSYTKLFNIDIQKVFSSGNNLQKLSLCEAKLNYSTPFMFKGTSLKLLDVSGNHQILNDQKALNGLEDTLEYVYAQQVNLKSFEVFNGFKKLKVIKISKNDLSFIRPQTALTLKSLQILDLDTNRFSIWFEPTFSLMPNLRYLSLRENNVNYVSGEIMNDLRNISYISLAKNFLICNCYTKELIMLAYENDKHTDQIKFTPILKMKSTSSENFNYAVIEFNYKVISRRRIPDFCSANNSCDIFYNDYEMAMNGKYVIIDYEPNDYQCLIAKKGTYVPFVEDSYCDIQRSATYDKILHQNEMKILLLLLIPPALIFLFLVRKRIKFFCRTMRNSALLSMMEQPGTKDDCTLYNYDVFVSYCNEDRAWVLDDFLPHMERESGISVCLHERDFQVGLSILENIVSCMDRSRCIMLLLSQKFLLSRWCQFEMHLAQHRLLETRREDLILILLEDIPKKLRPNTLHYLMVTKTYIVWPKEKDQEKLFWTRLKRSIVTQKMKYMDNVSIV